LSIIDMVMDVYMIIVFLQEERVLYAKATIACLSTNILFQVRGRGEGGRGARNETTMSKVTSRGS